MTTPIFERLCKRLRLGPNGCLEFQGFRNPKGYGRIAQGPGEKPRIVNAHRVAWEAAFGPIPDGMDVLHSCDNPPCCNPEHLFLGTNDDNVADRSAKGRGGDHTGENNGRSKLTREKVAAIRADTRTLHAIAADYGVGHTTIYKAKSGETWK
ncbi:hypothetical protein LCGC14_2044430 [marine sediment metagenome]|uniref:HNH nuclease domain-containing protein n=1 Tax=marine sediment metagenome TaxID=412755 RepID=A0A0F9HMW0_9ZZZZ